MIWGCPLRSGVPDPRVQKRSRRESITTRAYLPKPNRVDPLDLVGMGDGDAEVGIDHVHDHAGAVDRGDSHASTRG